MSTQLDMGSTNESHLVERARRGEAEAFAALCESVSARLYRQAVSLCGNAIMAEDLAQETLLAAWKGIRRYRGQCLLFTWLCGILVRLHHRSYRKRVPIGFSHLTPPDRVECELLLQWTAHPDDPPDALLQLGEREAALRRCLARLPEKQRQVVYLRFYVDTSMEGIAQALRCSVGTVKSRLFHALQKLARMPELNSILKP